MKLAGLVAVASVAILGLSVPAHAQESSTAAAEPKEKITDRSHPDYVRCRTERVIGSLAKRKKTCMTNREWAEVAREGNAFANEMVDEHRANATSGN